MRRIDVHNRCSDFDSYRASRVKSLFNAESGCDFRISADLPADELDWRIGVIVGPSGSGKTSIGRQFWEDVGIARLGDGWDRGKPIVDVIAPDGDFNTVTRRRRAWRRSCVAAPVSRTERRRTIPGGSGKSHYRSTGADRDRRIHQCT